MCKNIKLIYTVFVVHVFWARGNNPKRSSVETEQAVVAVRPVLDSILKAGVLATAETTDKWKWYKSPPPPLSESCLVMVFQIDPEMGRQFFSDSTVHISHKVCRRTYPMDGYKGVLSVDNYNVAVFDENNIGSSYYNADSLKMIPFDKFKCLLMKSFPTFTYYYKNDTLHYWNP